MLTRPSSSVRRKRHIAADPERSTTETVDAIRDLLSDALPSVAQAEVDATFANLRQFVAYLIPGEHLARDPLTLVAGTLACDIFTVHGEDAVGAEDASAPPGGANETSWQVYVPVPAGAPFTDAEVKAASAHLMPGPAPATVGEGKAATVEAAPGLADLLKLAGGGSG
jgi:hypothetical protein